MEIRELDNTIHYDFGLTVAQAAVLHSMIQDNHFWDQENDGEFLQPQEGILRHLEVRLAAFRDK